MTWGPTLFFAKGAILLLYLRIFTVNKRMRYSIWIGLATAFVLYWLTIPMVSYYCVPRAGDAWSIENIGASCTKDATFGIIQGVLSLSLDVYIFILPIPIILKLQMSLQRRLAVLSIFGTAFLWVFGTARQLLKTNHTLEESLLPS